MSEPRNAPRRRASRTTWILLAGIPVAVALLLLAVLLLLGGSDREAFVYTLF